MEAYWGRKVILPAIEVQAGVQATGRQATQVATENGDDTFSAAFGESLRGTAQGQSVAIGTGVDAKATDGADGNGVSGQSGRGVSSGLAAEISGRVAEAASQAVKQNGNQGAGTLVASVKTPATPINAAAASGSDVAKSSAGLSLGTVEEDLSIKDGSSEIFAGSTGARVRVESDGKSNLVKAGNGDENEEVAAAGSEVAKSEGAAAGVAAAGTRTSGLVNAASTVAAGKAAVAEAVDQTPGTAVASASALSQSVAAGAPAGKVVADPAAILVGAVKPGVAAKSDAATKPDAAALFALSGTPKSTAVKAASGSGNTTTAAGLRDTDALASAGMAQVGKLTATAIGDGEAGEQAQALAVAANTEVRSAVSAATASSGALTGAVQKKVAVMAKATSTAVPAAQAAKVQATKVQGAKSGVSGEEAAVAGGKGTTLETIALQASAAEVAANAAAGALSQRGTGAPAVQTAALEVPLALPTTSAATSATTSATTDAATIAASLASSLASRFAMLGVPLAQAEQAQGDASAIKSAADAKTGSKATGTAPSLEPDAKGGVAKAASAGDSGAVATTPMAAHAGATQVGAASVQAIAAAHLLPVASLPNASLPNSGSSTKTSVHSVQSLGSSPQAASGRAVAEANVPASVVAAEDKAPVAAATAGTAERPAVEGARTGDSGQQAAGVVTGQGVSRAGVNSGANQAAATATVSAANVAASTATSTLASAASSAPFSEAATAAGLHAASAPAGPVSVANGAVAATAGVIAAGHPAAVAGVAAGVGGGGTIAAGGVSAALSGVGGAARSDPATAAEPHRTLVATPNTLEVGVPDGTQGWLRIRAEVGDQGQVNASLAAASGASQEMLHRELPALNAYLHSEQMAVMATVSDRSFTAAGGGQTLAGGGDTSGAGGGAGGGTMTQGGASGGQQGNAGQQGTTTSSSVQSYSGTAGLSDVTIANSMGTGYDGESGRWLNVSA